MKYSALVLAAGKGTRSSLSYNKVFFKLHGEPLIKKTIQPFIEDEDCKQIVISIAPNELATFQEILKEEKIVYAYGGATRQESAYKGLEKVESEYVMIHDGARPFITNEQIEALKNCLKQEDACLLMVPLIDTIKKVDNGYVVHTPNRAEYFAAQTPQAFKTALIKECHQQAMLHPEISASDDAMLIELFSDVKIKVVEGSYHNLKVTTKKDIERFEQANRQQQ